MTHFQQRSLIWLEEYPFTLAARIQPRAALGWELTIPIAPRGLKQNGKKQMFARNNSSLWPHDVGSFLSIRQCTTPQVNINQEPQSLWIDKNQLPMSVPVNQLLRLLQSHFFCFRQNSSLVSFIFIWEWELIDWYKTRQLQQYFLLA